MLTLNTIQLKRMKLPLMKDDFSSSIKITIDSAIPLLGLDIHSHRDMKLHVQAYSLQHSLSEQSMVKKRNVHSQGSGEVNYGTSMQWNAVESLKLIRQNWMHRSRKISNIYYKMIKSKLPNNITYLSPLR